MIITISWEIWNRNKNKESDTYLYIRSSRLECVSICIRFLLYLGFACTWSAPIISDVTFIIVSTITYIQMLRAHGLRGQIYIWPLALSVHHHWSLLVADFVNKLDYSNGVGLIWFVLLIKGMQSRSVVTTWVHPAQAAMSVDECYTLICHQSAYGKSCIDQTSSANQRSLWLFKWNGEAKRSSLNSLEYYTW